MAPLKNEPGAEPATPVPAGHVPAVHTVVEVHVVHELPAPPMTILAHGKQVRPC